MFILELNHKDIFSTKMLKIIVRSLNEIDRKYTFFNRTARNNCLLTRKIMMIKYIVLFLLRPP